jgi:hypothetical protein
MQGSSALASENAYLPVCEVAIRTLRASVLDRLSYAPKVAAYGS